MREGRPRHQHPDLCVRLPGGPPEFVFRAAIQGRIQLVSSPPLLAEFGRVLSEKFDWEDFLVEEAVAQIVRHDRSPC